MVHRIEMVADIPHMRHRSNQAEVIGQLGHLGMQLIDLHPGDFGRNRLVRPTNRVGSLGFQVPGIELAGSPAEQDKDAGLRCRAAAEYSRSIHSRSDHSR